MSTYKNTTAPAFNQSAEKTMAILELLSQAMEPMRLTDIAEKLDSNAPTVLRFINSLQRCGYVMQDSETSKYCLTYKICSLSDSFLRRTDIRKITHPFLCKLTQIFQESACISIEQNGMMIYVDVAPGPDKSLMSVQTIGNISPMHCTGNGKLLLTNYSDEMLNEYISKTGLKKYTPNTITTKKELITELEKIRANGFSIDDEECETGLRCIAYPIYNYTGKIYAGVSITGPSSRITSELISEKKEHLKKAASDVSFLLGYTG